MIELGHPYRDRAPDAPPPSDEPGPALFGREHAIQALLGTMRRGGPLSREQAELLAELRRQFPGWRPVRLIPQPQPGRVCS